MKNKKVIRIGIIICALIVIAGLVFLIINLLKKEAKKEEKKKQPETSIKVNTNEGVIKDQEVEGNLMRNTSLIVEDGISYIVVEVTNNTGDIYQLDQYMINVKDASGNTIVKVPGYIGESLAVGETKTIRSMVNMDLSDATSVEYEVVK